MNINLGKESPCDDALVGVFNVGIGSDCAKVGMIKSAEHVTFLKGPLVLSTDKRFK